MKDYLFSSSLLWNPLYRYKLNGEKNVIFSPQNLFLCWLRGMFCDWKIRESHMGNPVSNLYVSYKQYIST